VPERCLKAPSAFFGRSDPEPDLPRDVNPKVQCAFDTLVLRISAVRTSYRIWLRSSSTYEPSDPPARLIILHVLLKKIVKKKDFAGGTESSTH
jgi:hypothetical protein